MTEPVARDPIYRRRRFQPETIELCVRWYLRYPLSPPTRTWATSVLSQSLCNQLALGVV